MFSVYHTMRDGSVVQGTHRYATLKSAETVAENVNDTRDRQLRDGLKWDSTITWADEATEDV